MEKGGIRVTQWFKTPEMTIKGSIEGGKVTVTVTVMVPKT